MKLRDALHRATGRPVCVHLIIKGRIGTGWVDIDRHLWLRKGTPLADLVPILEADGVPFTAILDESPHLRHTMMLNGERCPIEDNGARELEDGDALYLLAPFAGG